jgi:hypothetical protein
MDFSSMDSMDKYVLDSIKDLSQKSQKDNEELCKRIVDSIIKNASKISSDENDIERTVEKDIEETVEEYRNSPKDNQELTKRLVDSILANALKNNSNAKYISENSEEIIVGDEETLMKKENLIELNNKGIVSSLSQDTFVEEEPMRIENPEAAGYQLLNSDDDEFEKEDAEDVEFGKEDEKDMKVEKEDDQEESDYEEGDLQLDLESTNVQESTSVKDFALMDELEREDEELKQASNGIMEEIVDSILTPGVSPQVLAVMHSSFFALTFTLLILLFLTSSLYVVFLLLINAALWTSITLFVHEAQQSVETDEKKIQ